MRLRRDGKRRPSLIVPGPEPDDFRGNHIPPRAIICAVRRFLIGGIGGLILLGGAVQLLATAGGTGCNEPVPTNYGGNPTFLDRKNIPGEGGAEPLICSGGDGGGGGDGGCPSFATDLYPYIQANGKWRCADGACHGGTSAPLFNCEDPAACLTQLKGLRVANKAYVAEGTDPNESTLLCNLQGACGSRMPKPPGADPTNDELCMFDAWLRCGAPP